MAPPPPAPPRLVLDEPVDRWFSRPLARGVVSVLARTPITANQVTGVACLVGMASGVALALRDGPLFAILTALFLVLDCCDGQLARLRGGGGLLGRALDGIGDYATATSMHLGLMVWIAHLHGWTMALLWTLAAAAAMTWGAYLLDKYKRRFKGEVEDPGRLEREIAAASGWRRLALMTLRAYAAGLARAIPPADPATYPQRAALPMRFFLLGGHTMHATVWSVCALLERPLDYAYIAVGPFSLLALIGVLLQRRAERAAT